MQTTTITPERFSELRAALGWSGDRAWLLGARLVEGVPYRALAAKTGRTEEALRSQVKLARRQIKEHETQKRDQWGDNEAERLRDEQRYAGMYGKALLWWDLSDHHFPLWSCVLAMELETLGRHRYYARPVTAVEQVERLIDMVRWREQRMMDYLAGLAPHPT